MLPDPIEYRVMVNVQQALQGIAVTAGYHYDVATVAVKLDPNQNIEDFLVNADGTPKTRPLVLIEKLPEIWEYQESFGGLRLTVPVRVHHVNTSDPTVDTDRMLTFFRSCADVEQALAIDPGRGGLAVVTKVTNRAERATEAAASEVWATVDANVIIRRQFGQPNG